MSTTNSDGKKASELIPEGFDLESARRKQSSTPKSDLPKCPDCGSVTIIRKTSREDHPQRKDGVYRCESCGIHFDAPTRPRDSQSSLTRFGGGRR